MKRKPNWRNIIIFITALGLATYLLCAVIFSNGNEKERTCQKIEISIMDSSEVRFISSKDIRHILNKKGQKIVGKKQKEINTEKLEQLLSKDAVIKRAECYFLPSGNLGIRIWQRHPIMRVYGSANYYVDAEGHTFATSSNYTAYVIIVTGNASKLFITKKLKDLVLYSLKDSFWKSQIQQIDISEKGRITIVPTLGDHKIVLGSIDDYETKLKKLKTFYKNGLSKIGWGDYESINAEFKDQVVCTKKKP